MLARWMPLPLAMLAALSLGSTATAQQSPDPSTRAWTVELNGVLNQNEFFLFTPDRSGDGTWGTWENFEGNRRYGWGYYFWDPTTGTIEYINLSGDGGGNQTGTYTWDGTSYVRTRASHPAAPRMVLR